MNENQKLSLEEITHQRLIRRIEKRDKRIEGLERKVKKLEEALAWRTLDLESLTDNLHQTVQDALCNVRMIPVGALTQNNRIVEVRDIPAK